MQPALLELFLSDVLLLRNGYDITHIDHKSPATSLTVALRQAKAFDLKLTIRKTSINLSLRNNKNIKSTREQPSSDFIKLESPDTVCTNVPKFSISIPREK